MGILVHMLHKQIARERKPFVPVRLVVALGRVLDAGAARELGAAARAVAGLSGPVFAVHPEAVNVVFADKLQHLRNHVVCGVVAKRAGVVVVERVAARRRRLARGLDSSPVGMIGNRGHVVYA